MKLNNLPKITENRKKRIGRGIGSGKGGHTVGRGQKGQKARGKIKVFFEGTKQRKGLLKRLPLLRGKGKFKPGKKPLIVNIKYLNLLPADSCVDIKTLAKFGLVELGEAEEYGVKILGEGNLEKKLTVSLPCSRQAAEKIIAAGGKVAGKDKAKNE